MQCAIPHHSNHRRLLCCPRAAHRHSAEMRSSRNRKRLSYEVAKPAFKVEVELTVTQAGIMAAATPA